MKRKVKCIEVSHKKWNDFIFKLHEDRIIFINKKFIEGKTPIVRRAYTWEAESFVYLRAHYRNSTYWYKTSLTECKDDCYIGSGGVALTQLVKRSGELGKQLIHQFSDKKPLFSANSVLWYNPKYNLTRHSNCIGYDLNSAFSAAMLKPMPDTLNPLGPGIVQEGQIGFSYSSLTAGNCVSVFDDEVMLPTLLKREGQMASMRFNLIESPFKDFVDHYYTIKKNPKDLAEKQKAKQMLNYAVGALQNNNYIIRATILEYCNEYMMDLINKHRDKILFSNTDSIVALEPIPEIEAILGDGLGQWKIEHTGDFALKYLSYQWNCDELGVYETTYRGIPKKWFENFEKNYGHPFDILVDRTPTCGNNYYLAKNGEILQIEG